MSVLAFGIHHRSAPLELLEDLAIAPDDLPKVLARLTDAGDVREAVVLSTCQRVEVYADVARFHDAVQHVRQVVCDFSSRSPWSVPGRPPPRRRGRWSRRERQR